MIPVLIKCFTDDINSAIVILKGGTKMKKLVLLAVAITLYHIMLGLYITIL